MPQAFDDRIIPVVTFTVPELAGVGMTEEDQYRVGRVDFKKMISMKAR